MKKSYLLYFFLFIFHCANGQHSNDIIIGKIDTIDSKILNEERKIWVYVPEGNSDGLFSKKTYPVVYLLDGDAHFYSVVGMIQQLSSVNGNTICPKMIVVGIPNTNRTRDLTPTKGNFGDPYVDSTMIAQSGGGDHFLSFIEKELIPQIEAKYPTEPYRMLIGHSFGGLTVMNTFLHQPDLFDSYVSIDPSMWWDNQRLLNEVKRTTFDQKYSGKSLFLAIANTMKEGMDISSVQKDTTLSTKHIRSILELNTVLSKDSQKQLSFKGKYYANDDHGSVPLIAEYDALRFIFDFYRLKIDDQDYFNSERDFSAKIVKHYKRLSEAFRREIKPDEQFINGFGYQFLSMQQFKKAGQFFQLNVANYPESYNVYDSLGDWYKATGNKEKAIENYQKSVSLNKDSSSKIKLEELGKK